MKKVILAVYLTMFLGSVIADEYPVSSVPVQTNSTVVLPAMKPKSVTPYTTGSTNSQGTYISVPDSDLTFWMVSPVSGTNNGVLLTNYLANIDIVDGDVTYRSIPKTRNWFRLCNISELSMFYAEGSSAILNKGILIVSSNHFDSIQSAEIGTKCYQGAVSLITTATNKSCAVFTK